MQDLIMKSVMLIGVEYFPPLEGMALYDYIKTYREQH